MDVYINDLLKELQEKSNKINQNIIQLKNHVKKIIKKKIK